MTDIVAVGFVPAAPLLVPAVAGGSAALDADLRDGCVSVVRRLCDTDVDAVVVAAGWHEGASWPCDATWDFGGFGVTRHPPDERPRLPWPLGIGAWLLDEAGYGGDRCFVTVGPNGRTHAEIGPSRVAVLVVGDGSARRTEKAPGHLDERAEPFDAGIARALAGGDIGALADLDAGLATDLMCAGAPVWRWLAAEISGRQVTTAELLSDTAPYGVGYFVSWWDLSDSPAAITR